MPEVPYRHRVVFNDWVRRSRWWPEDAILALDKFGRIERIAGPCLALDSPPARVRCRYLSQPLQAILDAGTLDEAAVRSRVDAATQYVVELILDVEAGQGVCRHIEVDSATSRGRWTATFPPMLIETDTADRLENTAAGYISGVGSIPLGQLVDRLLGWWQHEAGMRQKRRRRTLTAPILKRVADAYRADPKRPVQSVMTTFGWTGVAGRGRAQRAIVAARREGELGLAPGPKRKGEAEKTAVLSSKRHP